MLRGRGDEGVDGLGGVVDYVCKGSVGQELAIDHLVYVRRYNLEDKLGHHQNENHLNELGDEQNDLE